MKKCNQTIVKDNAALVELMKVFEGDVAQYLPEPTKEKVLLSSKEAELVIPDLGVSEEPEWEGSFADLVGKMNGAKTQLQETMRTVKVYAEEAKAATAQSDP